MKNIFELDMEAMKKAPHAKESFALIALLNADNKMLMDNEYVRAILAYLTEQSGQDFADLARFQVCQMRGCIREEGREALEELGFESLVEPAGVEPNFSCIEFGI